MDARPDVVDARPDLAPDLAPDAGAGTCPASGATDVGAPSKFTNGMATYFASGAYFVCRDSKGLYTVSSLCTHEGATIQAQATQFYCPRHGATFDLNGAVTKGPASRALAHYSLCLMSNGNVGVVKSMTVAATTRLVA